MKSRWVSLLAILAFLALPDTAALAAARSHSHVAKKSPKKQGRVARASLAQGHSKSKMKSVRTKPSRQIASHLPDKIDRHTRQDLAKRMAHEKLVRKLRAKQPVSEINQSLGEDHVRAAANSEGKASPVNDDPTSEIRFDEESTSIPSDQDVFDNSSFND